jgi:pimeloyl-ACP methyl ester carboxylesterase
MLPYLTYMLPADIVQRHRSVLLLLLPLLSLVQVYAVDLLGHGGSWPSQHFCEHSGQQLHYNVATYTEQLHSFIQERIGQPVYVAGNSLGGGC